MRWVVYTRVNVKLEDHEALPNFRLSIKQVVIRFEHRNEKTDGGDEHVFEVIT